MVVAVEIDSLPTRKLRKQVGQKTFAAGCRYYSSGRVTEAHREGDWIVGTVTGSGHEDYQVRIQLSAKSGTLLKAESTCTYTSGYGKHEVALALAALADPTLRLAESAGWGGLLDQAEEVAREFTSNGEQEERLVVRLWLPMTPDDAPRVRLFKVRYGKKGRGAERPLQHWQLKAALDGDKDAVRRQALQCSAERRHPASARRPRTCTQPPLTPTRSARGTEPQASPSIAAKSAITSSISATTT